MIRCEYVSGASFQYAPDLYLREEVSVDTIERWKERKRKRLLERKMLGIPCDAVGERAAQRDPA